MNRLSRFILIILGTTLLSLNAQEMDRFEAKYIYSDGTERYRTPREPGIDDSVVVKIRVKTNSVTDVILHYNQLSVPMVQGETAGIFDYYYAEIPPGENPVLYYFEVAQDKKRVFYSRQGIHLKKPGSSYQFKIFPGFSTPEWMRGAVLYQIFIDRFYNGDPANDVMTNEYMYDNWPSVKVEDWNQLPDGERKYAEGSNRTREFYGGDIEGVIQKLDYLKELGVDGIYFNPLFVSPSNHKYDTQDYENIDPHLGVIVNDEGELINPEEDPNYQNPVMDNASEVNETATRYIKRTTDPANLDASNEKLKELIDEAHKRGIKVILDGVFNHSGSFNKWFDREHIYTTDGAYESKESPFARFYNFDDENRWPDNETYHSWWGFKTLPKLNFEGDPALEKKILDMAAGWVDFGVDGWRLDVAADLGYSVKYNHEFYQKLRKSVKDANEDAVILAEVYGDSSVWLQGDEWDTIMNYDAFFEPVSYYLTGLEKHSYYNRDDLYNDSESFARDLMEKMAKMPYNSLEIAMNQLDNHDHSRFITRTNRFVDTQKSNEDVSDLALADENLNKGILKQAVAMQMIFPGAPTLYYGNEAGLPGFTDPDSRRTFPWGKEDQELLSFYKDIIGIHKEYSSLKSGSFTILKSDSKGIFSAARWDEKNTVILITNNNEKEKTVTIPLDVLNLEKDAEFNLIFKSSQEAHESLKEIIKVSNKMKISIPAFGTIIAASSDIIKHSAQSDSLRPALYHYNNTTDEKGRIKMIFNQKMHQAEIQNAFSIKPEVEGSFAWNHTTAYFIPDSPLENGKYIVTIKPEIRSRSGNLFLDKEYSWDIKVK